MKTHDIFIAHPNTLEQVNALKAFMKALRIEFEIAKEKDYNLEFVAKINESKAQARSGKVTRVEKENIKDFLGL